MFIYNCPYCNTEMNGMSSENVYCKSCDITFEATCDLVNEHTNETHRYEGWLTGRTIKGHFESETCWDWGKGILKLTPFGMIACTRCHGYTVIIDKDSENGKPYEKTCEACSGLGYTAPIEKLTYLPYKTLSVR